MRAAEKVFCRVFQTAFRVALPVLPYREPKILKEVKLIPKLLQQKKIKRVLLVTDTGVRGLGLTNRLELGLKEAVIQCTVYDKVVANPTIINIEEARKLYLKSGAQAIIALAAGLLWTARR